MKLDPTQIALIRIAERRNESVAERQRLSTTEYRLGYQHEAGIVCGLQIALDLLREAGLPVTSAEYLAVGNHRSGGRTAADGSQEEPRGRAQ